jgi:hypothetical protein
VQFLAAKRKKLLRAFFFLLSSAIFGLSMSKNHSQLSCEQRYQIEALLKVGLIQKSIAEHSYSKMPVFI